MSIESVISDNLASIFGFLTISERCRLRRTSKGTRNVCESCDNADINVIKRNKAYKYRLNSVIRHRNFELKHDIQVINESMRRQRAYTERNWCAEGLRSVSIPKILMEIANHCVFLRDFESFGPAILVSNIIRQNKYLRQLRVKGYMVCLCHVCVKKLYIYNVRVMNQE